MRHIHMQPLGTIPRDEEFHFRTRAKALVDKWHVIVKIERRGVVQDATSTSERKSAQTEDREGQRDKGESE